MSIHSRLFRWLVGAEPQFVVLDRVTLKQASDFTTREFDGAAAIVSVTRIPAWRVRREKLVREMQARQVDQSWRVVQGGKRSA